jgi:starvation-inducible outer membrane lipoprotein
MAITTTLVLSGCANLPRHYVRMAEPGTTLTMLTAHPEIYQGKVVLLGGTILEEGENEQDLWLHVVNRPLDQDYIPLVPRTGMVPKLASTGWWWQSNNSPASIDSGRE